MKKILFLFVFFLAIKSTEAQLIKIPVKAVLTGSITKLNFHKPKTECLKGFGFCLKGTLNFTITANERMTPPTYIDGDKVVFYGIKMGTTFELHAPVALKQVAGNDLLDFSNFELEDGNYIAYSDGTKTITSKLKSGIYPVKLVNNDYVVTITTE